MHYGDLKNWVIKVINSCETLEQLRTADKLRNLFENHQSHSHLNFRDRINLFEEVRTAYYIKDIMLMNEWEKKLSNS